jgi:L-rhamnose isomerase
MNLELLIIDNFYSNPDSVRDYALRQPFDVTGNYPGKRTKPYLPPDLKDAIQYWMNPVGKITNWFEEYGYTGAFQSATSIDRTWIHADHFNKWAGVCYLTPNAPLSGGTAIYKHKASGEYTRSDKDYEGRDYTKWDLVDRVGNKYNRLVLYRGDLFHASIDYFGENIFDGRLFQTFFFDTE